MPQLAGEYTQSLTQKNRVVVPAAWRNQLNTTAFFVSTYSNRYLEVYPQTAWEDFYHRLVNFSLFNPDLKDWLRLILSQGQFVETDNQGRLLLTEHILKVLKLDKGEPKELVCLGLGDHFEIWDSTHWQIKKQGLQKEADNLAMRLALFETKQYEPT